MDVPRGRIAATYSAKKPRALGAPVSPAPIVVGVVVRDRMKRGVDAEARMSGRQRVCMVMLDLKLEVDGWVIL
jgi:hypothetical protein